MTDLRPARLVTGALAFVCAIVLCTTASATTADAREATTVVAQAGSSKRSTRSGGTAKRTAAARTLEAITIEGEIAVPQVLFITSRDFRRYRDGLALKFRMNSFGVAQSVELPARLRVVAQSKEESK